MQVKFVHAALMLGIVSIALVRCTSSPEAPKTTLSSDDSITHRNDSIAMQITKDSVTAAEKKTAEDSIAAAAVDPKEKKETASRPDTTHKVPHDIVSKPEHKYLNLVIKGLKSATAPIVVGVYGPNNKFLDESDQMKVYKFTPSATDFQTQIKDLDYGEFAFALYQDVDNDGKMTKNVIGMPTEPYAFSNNYKPVIRAPKFKECEFTYNANTNTVTVSMIK